VEKCKFDNILHSSPQQWERKDCKIFCTAVEKWGLKNILFSCMKVGMKNILLSCGKVGIKEHSPQLFGNGIEEYSPQLWKTED
jgi:hypothetical protein